MDVLIAGDGSDAELLLNILQQHKEIKIIGLAGPAEESPSARLARRAGIPTATDLRSFANRRVDVIIDTTSDPKAKKWLKENIPDGCDIICGKGAKLLLELMKRLRDDNVQMEALLTEHRALYHIGLILSSTDNLSDVYKTIVEYATLLTGSPAGSLAVFNEKSGEMLLEAATGLIADLSRRHKWKLRPGGLTEYILNQKEAVPISDLAEHADFVSPKLLSEGIRSLIACPLYVEGRIVGIIYVDDFSPRNWTEREISSLSLLSTYAAVAIERARLLEETRLLAITDDLTSLYNHRYFVQRLMHEVKRARRYRQPLSLLMLDIDHFKKYNDQHGHIKGNEVLKRVAALLVRESRDSDIAVRYGGEEFSIILPQTTNKDAISLAERLREQVEKEEIPHRDTQPEGKLTISIGVATFPDDTISPVELVEMADVALYRAKRLGRNRVCSYMPEPTACL